MYDTRNVPATLAKPTLNFFARHSINVNLSNVRLVDEKAAGGMPLLWPRELQETDIYDLFCRIFFENYGLKVYFASNLLPGLVHWPRPARPYVRLVKRHVGADVYNRHHGLALRSPFDASMTLPEALLYNLMLADRYGDEYIRVISSATTVQRCYGTDYVPSMQPVRLWWSNTGVVLYPRP